MKRKILIEPDPILRKKSEPLDKVDDEIRKLMQEMLKTMYDAPGIGLAAVQVGILKRIIVIDVTKDEKKRDPLFLVNPEIIYRSKETATYEEGCLSVPNYYENVKRANKIKVSALNEHGQPFEIDADETLAVCIQHEMDHLNGILFVDHLSKLKQKRLKKKAEKQSKKL